MPTATLSIALAAFLLSEDKAPVRAAYRHAVALADRENWLAVLKAGSDAPVLTQFYESDARIAELLGRATLLGVRKLWRDVSPADRPPPESQQSRSLKPEIYTAGPP